MKSSLRFVAGFACACSLAIAANDDVLTSHNNNARSGLDENETLLTPRNVTKLKILFQAPVDGQVYAQPLCVAKQLVYRQGVSKGRQDVVLVATEHGSVYALDAVNGDVYWQVSLLTTGFTPVQASDPNIGCTEIAPEISITATPVIDRLAGPNGRVFIIGMETDGQGDYAYKLHALDLATGKEALTPVTISASVTGAGPGRVFNATRNSCQSGLLLLNGVIYSAWGSLCENPPFAGWVLGNHEGNLKQAAIFNDNPNGNPASTYLPDGSGGGIWQSGLGPATDGKETTSKRIYLATGNGPFDQTLKSGFPGNQDYSGSVLRLGISNGLSVEDYFTPDNEQQEADAGVDLSSGGTVILPDIFDKVGRAHHLLVVAGEDANLYLLNRDNLGKFAPLANNIYQEIPGVLGSGAYSSAATFNTSIYVNGIGIPILKFNFNYTNPDQPVLNSTPAAQTAQSSFQYPGCTPSISSNGNKNGVVWAYENQPDHAVLHAYEATNLAELYNSGTQLGSGVPFAVPTVFSGRVYVGTSNSLVAFGL
jgi:outer membrane protein assembly factor BamB